MNPEIEIKQVSTDSELEVARHLFIEYSESLGFDLSFQDFERELRNLPGDYAPPRGCILLAFQGKSAAGCVALRPLEQETCEMKRLYVRPGYRGHRLGKFLADEIVREGRRIGYRAMRLDTAPWMDAAISLYQSLGFTDIPPYRENPIEGARFMELIL